jgi:hypothetical protein
MCGCGEWLFWWGKNTVALQVETASDGTVHCTQRDHHILGVGYGTRKRLYQLVATSLLVFLLLRLHDQLLPWVAYLLEIICVVAILIPSLPNLLNPLEIHRRRSWHFTHYTNESPAKMLVEADVSKYKQIHFNGTLQVKGVAYDVLSTANKSNLTIVDGVDTDAHDFTDKFRDGMEAMLMAALEQPNGHLSLSGFSRGGYAAIIAAYILHQLVGNKPLLLVGDPVIGHTPAMPRNGLHQLLIEVLRTVKAKGGAGAALEWLEMDSAEALLATGIDDTFKSCSDKLTTAMIHPQSCAYLACGEVRRMMDPYLPHGISSCGILYSGFHTTFIDPASENPFLTSLKQSGVGRGICSLPVIKQAFAFDADLARRDAIFPAMRQDAENRRMAFIAPLDSHDNGGEGGGGGQNFSDPIQLGQAGQSGLLQLDGRNRIVSSAGRADDWLLSVGFDVGPSICDRFREHFNNLNASELTVGRKHVINRILAARTKQDQGAAVSRGIL